ncbi:MAG TPA: HAMP domain-containing sensor histidine kinase [Acidimicrobiia bacterium]|nr:HAMP domain-containing sensor histidine kinase [Acidimicrobiia bacterium]
MTLRARLLIGLLVLAAIGLAVGGGITYRQQRDFLITRFDQQLDTIARSRGMQDALAAAVQNQQRVQLISGPNDIVAEVHTFYGVEGYASTRDDAPALPENPKGYFTIRSPHYRGVVVTDQDGNQYIVAMSLHDVDQSLHHLLFGELTIFAIVLLVLGVLAWWVVKLGLRPLEQMEETAGAIAAGDLSRRVEVVDEHTEVGRLGIALNEMLHQIETAFDERAASEARLRRFVADASHELRTPLTSIRGYAELFRRGAADRPEDLAKAMRRIEEEADRMGVLVDDLLLLARLDQGRPLELQPVDLTRLATDAVDDARAISPARPFDLSSDGTVVVAGDEVRLRQVLANLLQNANRYTPPDTPVHVRVGTAGDDAFIEVADEGPGMSEDDARRAFERFWRADPSRTRASGGAGLGLSIVSAIAEAHGGRASVETAPGRGATFRVQLPFRPPAPNGEESAFAAAPDEPAASPPPISDIPVAELEQSS